MEPCQNILQSPPGASVSLDIFLTVPDDGANDEIQQWKPIAWETHFELLGDDLPKLTGPIPVMEQGLGRLLLEGLVSSSSVTDGGLPDYLTLQNHYDELSGQLDYSVLALFPDKVKVPHPVLQVADETRWLIGRMDVTAGSDGRIDLLPNQLNPKPFQAIFATSEALG